MAGILGFLGGDTPQGGILGGGQMQAAPKWATSLGLIGAALKDAAASYNGHDSNSVGQFQDMLRQNQLRQAYANAASGDQSARAQAYSAIVANGGDPSALQKFQASQALPQLLQNLQPSMGFNDNPVGVTPAVNAQGPDADAQRAAAQAINAGPSMSMQPSTLTGALARTGSPELSSEFAQPIINAQIAAQTKAKRTMTPSEIKSAGLPSGTAALTDNFGNIEVINKSDLKSQGAMDQELALKAADPSLGVRRAELAEKQREFNLSNPAIAGEGGGAAQPLSAYAPAVRNTVQSMLDGRMAPPTSFAMTKPYWQNMLAIANAQDPTFDQTVWASRVAARKDATAGGKTSQLFNSGNTAIQHLGRLFDQIPDVAGHQIPLIGNLVNRGENALAQSSGVPGVNAYNDTAGHLSEELTKFYRGTGGSEKDIERNMSNLGADLSGQAKQAGVANTVHLIYGAFQPKVEQYNKTMGTHYPVSHFLSQKSVETIRRMGYDPDTGEKITNAQSSAALSPQSLPRLGGGTTKSGVKFQILGN